MTKENFEANFTLPPFEQTTLLSQAYNQFDKELQVMLDRVAPSKTINITNKPRKLWFNKYIRDQRNVVRNRERTWKCCGSEHQWKASRTERNIYNRLLIYHKYQSLTKKIKECNKDTKTLFSIVNDITNNKKNPMPEGKNPNELKEDLATFFLDKITKIHEKFTNIDPYIPDQNQVPKFTRFAPMTNKEGLEMMSAMKNKSCELDTMTMALL